MNDNLMPTTDMIKDETLDLNNILTDLMTNAEKKGVPVSLYLVGSLVDSLIRAIGKPPLRVGGNGGVMAYIVPPDTYIEFRQIGGTQICIRVQKRDALYLNIYPINEGFIKIVSEVAQWTSQENHDGRL